MWLLIFQELFGGPKDDQESLSRIWRKKCFGHMEKISGGNFIYNLTVWILKSLSPEPVKLFYFCEVFYRTLCRTHPSSLHNSSPTKAASKEAFKSWEKMTKQSSEWHELFKWQENGWMLKCRPEAVEMMGRSFVARFNRTLKAPGAIGRHQGLSLVCNNYHLNHRYFSSWLP